MGTCSRCTVVTYITLTAFRLTFCSLTLPKYDFAIYKLARNAEEVMLNSTATESSRQHFVTTINTENLV